MLQGSKLRGCVVGCNSYIGDGCELVNTMILGNDTYTNDASRAASRRKGEVVLGIGELLLSSIYFYPSPPPLITSDGCND